MAWNGYDSVLTSTCCRIFESDLANAETFLFGRHIKHESLTLLSVYPRIRTWCVTKRPGCVFFFGVRIMLGTILGRFSIIYFRGLGLRIKVMVWVMVRARVRVRVGVGVMVSVVLWSW